MDITLDPNSPVPLFQQLHDGVVEGIATGELAPGDPLVSVRGLASAFGINPATVVKAYDLLRANGFVVTNDRSGTVVALSKAGESAWRERLRAVLVEGRAHGLSDVELHDEVDRFAAEFVERSVEGAR